jgi:hypothetical protein
MILGTVCVIEFFLGFARENAERLLYRLSHPNFIATSNWKRFRIVQGKKTWQILFLFRGHSEKSGFGFSPTQVVGQVEGVEQDPFLFVEGSEARMVAIGTLGFLEIIQGFAQLFQGRLFIPFDPFGFGTLDAGGDKASQPNVPVADGAEDMSFQKGYVAFDALGRTVQGLGAMRQNLKVRPAAECLDWALFQTGQLGPGVVECFEP